MDFDPLNSALFTGKGTPWGPGQSNSLSSGGQNYETNPSNINTGVDYNGMIQSMTEGLNQQRAQSDVGSQQQVSQANPYGASGNTGYDLGQSQAATQNAIAQGTGNIEEQKYQDQLNTMNAYNTNLQDQTEVNNTAANNSANQNTSTGVGLLKTFIPV